MALAPTGTAAPAPRRRRLLMALVGAAAGLVAACDRLPGAARWRGVDVTGASYGRRLALTDQHGRPRTLADFRGQVVLLYFGYVQCPDVCPTALSRAVAVRQALGDQAGRLQVVFVTVDPERDTRPMLQEYMAAFDPSFLALSGSLADTRAAADEFRVFYQKVPNGDSYTMDHTAMSYLFDTQGRLRVVLRHEQTVDDYTADVRALLAEPEAAAGAG